MKKFHVAVALFVFLSTTVGFAHPVELPSWSHVPYLGCEDRAVRVEPMPPWTHVPHPGCEDHSVRY